MGGSSSPSKTSTTTTPWSGVQPYLKDYLQQGQQVSQTPFQFYSGDQIAPFSPEQQMGLGMQTQRAIQGSPVASAAQRNITNTLQGQYMTPETNPWLQTGVNQALGDVRGRIGKQFGNASFGGVADQGMLARNLGAAEANVYGQNWEDERMRQMQAAGMAPTLGNLDYQDIAALQGVGGVRQQLAQDYLNQASGLYGDYIGYPAQQLDAYGNVVRTGMGGGSTTTGTAPGAAKPNRLAGAASGALMGAQIGSAIPGIGTAIGAVGGGLMGAIASDVRLKSNIKRIGTHKKGFGIYEYDIFGRHEVGVLAQEVEQVMPEAVTLHPAGYKQVYYAML